MIICKARQICRIRTDLCWVSFSWHFLLQCIFICKEIQYTVQMYVHYARLSSNGDFLVIPNVEFPFKVHLSCCSSNVVMTEFSPIQTYQPSPPSVPSSTASTLNSTENSNTSATEQTSDRNSFSNYPTQNTYQPRQPWQARNQRHPSFSHQNEKVRFMYNEH